MNAPLRRVAISVLVLFTLLILNVNYIQVVRSDELRKNTSNTRVLAAEYDRERGAIIVAGEPVALSVPTDGRLRYLRTYPQAGLYAAVTGYYSLIFTNEGIERAENDILSGEDRGWPSAGWRTCSPAGTLQVGTSSSLWIPPYRRQPWPAWKG